MIIMMSIVKFEWLVDLTNFPLTWDFALFKEFVNVKRFKVTLFTKNPQVKF